MKFYLKQVYAEINHQGNPLTSLNTHNVRTITSNRINDTGRPELIYHVENILEPVQVVNIKNFIALNTKTRIENVSLFINPHNEQDCSYGLCDKFDVLKFLNNKSLSTNFLTISGTFNTYNTVNTPKETGPTLYYKLLTDIPLCKITIKYFLTNIDQILLEVSTNCSVYILKYLIRKKLLIPEQDQNLIDLNSQRAFKNDEIIGNILNPNDNSAPLCSTNVNISTSALNKEDLSNLNISNFDNNNNTLKIQLILKGQRKCLIGIDFSFNILKDIKKIGFNEEAPSFREASDGMNIFCYCKSKNCKIFEEMFVKNIGSGKFDLLKEISNLKCPKCKLNKIEARNIGFINCEWNYKGYLSNKKNCCISGDGLTIDDKLYILNEISLNKYIEKLEINVKDKIYIPPEAKKHIFDDVDSEGEFDYDSIGLESIRSNNIRNTNILKVNSKDLTIKDKNNVIQNVINIKNQNFKNDDENSNKKNSNLIIGKMKDFEIITEKNHKWGFGNCINLFGQDTKIILKSNEVKKENIDKCSIF